jgi:hypothetical protein
LTKDTALTLLTKKAKVLLEVSNSVFNVLEAVVIFVSKSNSTGTEVAVMLASSSIESRRTLTVIVQPPGPGLAYLFRVSKAKLTFPASPPLASTA